MWCEANKPADFLAGWEHNEVEDIFEPVAFPTKLQELILNDVNQ